jgi:hypothetical protein
MSSSRIKREDAWDEDGSIKTEDMAETIIADKTESGDEYRVERSEHGEKTIKTQPKDVSEVSGPSSSLPKSWKALLDHFETISRSVCDSASKILGTARSDFQWYAGQRVGTSHGERRYKLINDIDEELQSFDSVVTECQGLSAEMGDDRMWQVVVSTVEKNLRRQVEEYKDLYRALADRVCHGLEYESADDIEGPLVELSGQQDHLTLLPALLQAVAEREDDRSAGEMQAWEPQVAVKREDGSAGPEVKNLENRLHSRKWSIWGQIAEDGTWSDLHCTVTAEHLPYSAIPSPGLPLINRPLKATDRKLASEAGKLLLKAFDQNGRPFWTVLCARWRRSNRM